MSGNITSNLTVWCSACEKWHTGESNDSRSDFQRAIRKLGWKRRFGKGWTCPQCVEESKSPGGWMSTATTSPPSDTMVETKGGYSDDRIVEDYFSSSIGDWMRQPGDPTHWRYIPKYKIKTGDNHG